MYKVIEISELIGSICIVKEEEFTITIDTAKKLMSDVRTNDQFVSTRLTNMSIRKAYRILGYKGGSSYIAVPASEKVRNEFVREFYRLDLETRDLLQEVIKLHIRNYGL